MNVEIICGKCGVKIKHMKTLRPPKDVMRKYDEHCPSCGQKLNVTDFTIDVE